MKRIYDWTGLFEVKVHSRVVILRGKYRRASGTVIAIDRTNQRVRVQPDGQGMLWLKSTSMEVLP